MVLPGDMTITIATRSSNLAIIQSRIVENRLKKEYQGIQVQLLEVLTTGDKDQVTPLSSFGNTGVFVKGVEEKLLSGEADIAVHSLKDVPVSQHEDLILAAYPEREDVRDVLVSNENLNWRELKQGAVVGTSSPARKEQLRLLRPDITFKDIRGNVEKRINKVKSGEYDATILAAAGLIRLGFNIEEQTYFTLDEMVPSPGQGALVIQCRKKDLEIQNMLRWISRPEIDYQVEAERKFMQVIGGGCRYPVAAHAELFDAKYIFRAIAKKTDFKKLVKVKDTFKMGTLRNDSIRTAGQILRDNLYSKDNS